MSGPPSSVDIDGGSSSDSSSTSLTYYEKKYGGGGTSSTGAGGPPPGIDISSFVPSYTQTDKGERRETSACWSADSVFSSHNNNSRDVPHTLLHQQQYSVSYRKSSIMVVQGQSRRVIFAALYLTRPAKATRSGRGYSQGEAKHTKSESRPGVKSPVKIA